MIAAEEGRPPEAYPEELVSTFQSRTAGQILVRPILPSDAPGLKEAFEALSPESIYRRFFTLRRNLSDEEARNFATVDYEQSLALVATPSDEPERLVAVARFAPTEQREGAVEMAIVVIDAFQGQGIGRRLFTELVAAARDRGHRWMLVETQPDNERMIELAEDAGYEMEVEQDGTALQIWLDLTAPENQRE
ncbi:MAG: GNAT family N-acetyltransferase [Chloroflexota bacterium]|nr:GNAT family N-acetyltransferase [Chloroflexota bacterium]